MHDVWMMMIRSVKNDDSNQQGGVGGFVVGQ
jgi:hypothetical protein